MNTINLTFRKATTASILAGILVSALMVRTPANACTSVFLEGKGGRLVAGQNLDWFIDDGLLVINKRNVTKRGAWGDQPAEWTARYASITANLSGVGFPSRGMNEAGLVIGSMWLGETKYPERDARPSISGDQWIQYELDTCATVAEVLASDKVLRIEDDYPSHYLVSDTSGECAVLEWFDGKLRAYRGDAVKVKAVVNSPYAECLARGDDWTGRFAKVSRLLDAYTGEDPVKYMFSILEATWHKTTQWSLVFDVKNLRIHYTTARNPARRSVSLKDFDLSCDSPVQILDINAPGEGDMRTRFKPYSYEENARIARVMLDKWAAHHGPISEQDITTTLDYYATMHCLTNEPATVTNSDIPVVTNHVGDPPTLRGPYLGQKPPGLTAEPFAPAALSIPGKNHHTLSFSTDGKELYFSRYPEHVTMVMRQVDGVWQAPERAPFVGWEAVFTPDGKSLFVGDGDLFRITRTTNGWSQPEKLKGAVNTEEYEYYASCSRDGTLYFSRRVNERATILRARPSQAGYGAVEELEPVVNGENAYHPFIAPDGSYLLFNSFDRPGRYGGPDLYVSFRQPDGTFGVPANLGPGVNSPDADLCPVVSPDGKYLFFTRLGKDSDGNMTGTPYWVSTRVIDSVRPKPPTR